MAKEVLRVWKTAYTNKKDPIKTERRHNHQVKNRREGRQRTVSKLMLLLDECIDVLTFDLALDQDASQESRASLHGQAPGLPQPEDPYSDPLHDRGK